MAPQGERRRVARLAVSAQLSGRGIGELQVRLLDLSAQGARIEHTRPFPDRALCFLDLPPALGGATLQGELIWTHITEYRPDFERKSAVCFQSGLRFLMLTGEQEAHLAEALRILKAAQAE
jgi:hypothetical protein